MEQKRRRQPFGWGSAAELWAKQIEPIDKWSKKDVSITYPSISIIYPPTPDDSQGQRVREEGQSQAGGHEQAGSGQCRRAG